jgi:hypothetical protein
MIDNKIDSRIKSELQEKGYSFVRGQEISFLYKNFSEWKSFENEWNKLGTDNYLEGDRMFRLRRYGKVGFIPSKGKIWRYPNTKYFQDISINNYAGGVEREFEPLTDEIVCNSVFQKTLISSFDMFDIEQRFYLEEWIVETHLFRILAEPNQDSSPTPEGIHRDGFPFGSIHLIGKKNVMGGETIIYTLDEERIESSTLTNRYDSLYAFDNRIKHYVTPVTTDNEEGGMRDILIFGFHLPKSKYCKG